MSAGQFLTFRKFSNEDVAGDLIAFLDEENIPYEVEENNIRADITSLTVASPFTKEISIKLRQEDFTRANTLWEEAINKQLNDVDKDYYLYSFTDEELTDVITRPDEWSTFDFLLAQKIFRSRGADIKPEVINELKQNRLQVLARPEESQAGWIVAGYLLALAGGLLAIFIGWHLSTFKRTLPNGEQVFGYTETDRKHGKIILLLGSISFIIWLWLRYK